MMNAAPALDLDNWQFHFGLMKGALISLGATSDVMRSLQWMIDNVSDAEHLEHVENGLGKLIAESKPPKSSSFSTFKPIGNIDGALPSTDHIIQPDAQLNPFGWSIEQELELAKLVREGLRPHDIALKLNRKYQSTYAKIRTMKSEGKI